MLGDDRRPRFARARLRRRAMVDRPRRRAALAWSASTCRAHNSRHARADARMSASCKPSGEQLPFHDGAFDTVFCDHGAIQLLRARPSSFRRRRACFDPADCSRSASCTRCSPHLGRGTAAPTRRLQLDYDDLGRMEFGEGTIDWALPAGQWIDVFAPRLHDRAARGTAAAGGSRAPRTRSSPRRNGRAAGRRSGSGSRDSPPEARYRLCLETQHAARPAADAPPRPAVHAVRGGGLGRGGHIVNLKRWLAAVLMLAVFGTVLTACGPNTSPSKFGVNLFGNDTRSVEPDAAGRIQMGSPVHVLGSTRDVARRLRRRTPRVIRRDAHRPVAPRLFRDRRVAAHAALGDDCPAGNRHVFVGPDRGRACRQGVSRSSPRGPRLATRIASRRGSCGTNPTRTARFPGAVNSFATWFSRRLRRLAVG